MFPLKDEVLIVAEIGVNHEGSLTKAIELTKLACEAGADIVKFQSYTPERFISADHSERRERVTQFALSEADYLSLCDIVKQSGALFMSTPVTEDWVTFLDPLCCAFKIASGDITFKPVIQAAVRTGKAIFLSTGAATLDEIDQAVTWIQDMMGDAAEIKERLTLLHCVSAYPTPIEEANILSIPFLKKRYKLAIGYSNHVVGMSACLAAVALGATVIEVHFTDQKEGRTFRDHALSFDASDLKKFIQSAKEIRQSLGDYDKKIQPCEVDNIRLMRKGVIAARDLRKGDILTPEDLLFARPATEFCAHELELLIGKQLEQDVMQGYLVPRNSVGL